MSREYEAVREFPGEGTDTVIASVSYQINYTFGGAPPEVEVLRLANPQGSESFFLIGNRFAQTIIGNAGPNGLSTGGGADTLIGLGGDDTYIIDGDPTGVMVREQPGQGVDQVMFSYGTFLLDSDAAVELITLGAGADNAIGNGYAQRIIGNDRANTLIGGGGDTLAGMGGNDTYLVQTPGDVVLEDNFAGFDTVYTTISYNLGANEIEVLSTVQQSDTVPLNLIGNYATQIVVGNYGNNILNGGTGGIDTLIGLFGDDTYAVGDSHTTLVEQPGQGVDTVVVSVDYTLARGVSVEVLAAQDRFGSAPLALRGNEFAQTIAGNAGRNTIDGGAGADTLIGGAEADRFLFTTALGGGNIGTLADFGTGADTIGLASSIFAVGGAVTASNFTTGPAATTADHRLIYDPGTGGLFYDADGSGAGAAVQFAQLRPGLALTPATFEVIPPAGTT